MLQITWKMAIEIVDLLIKNGDFPQLCYKLPEGSPSFLGASLGSHGLPQEGTEAIASFAAFTHKKVADI